MQQLIFKQHRPAKAWYIGGALFALSFLCWGQWNQVVTLASIAILIIGFESKYAINDENKNATIYGFFGIPLFKKKAKILYPDYISIFNTNQKSNNEYGPVAALGSVSKDAFFVIRLFKENNHFTLYKSKKYDQVYNKAEALSKMLNVDLINKTKK